MSDKITLNGNNTAKVVDRLIAEREARLHDAYIRKEIVIAMIDFADKNLKEGQKVTARLESKVKDRLAHLPVKSVTFNRSNTFCYTRLIIEFEGKSGGVPTEEIVLTSGERNHGIFFRDKFNKTNGLIFKARQEQYANMKPDMKPEKVRQAITSHVHGLNEALSLLHSTATDMVVCFPELEYAFKFDHPVGAGVWLEQYF